MVVLLCSLSILLHNFPDIHRDPGLSNIEYRDNLDIHRDASINWHQIYLKIFEHLI